MLRKARVVRCRRTIRRSILRYQFFEGIRNPSQEQVLRKARPIRQVIRKRGASVRSADRFSKSEITFTGSASGGIYFDVLPRTEGRV